MKPNQEVSLVSLAELYLYFFKQDHALAHALEDPRATEITADQVIDQWQPNTVNPEDAWALKGLGPFSLAAIHYWRREIGFHYLDVGANVGLTAIGQAIFHKRCGRGNLVYAFEPGEVFSLLQRAVEPNRVSDLVTCVKAAASDEAGEVSFYLTPAQSPGSSLLAAAVNRPGVGEWAATTVEALTIDTFLDRQGQSPGLLVKIDAEGADFKVLEGMKRCLSDRLCTIQIEFFPSLVEIYSDPAGRLLSLALDFEIIHLGSAQSRRILPDRRSLEDFMAHVRTLPIPATDIFLVPKKLPGSEDLIARILSG